MEYARRFKWIIGDKMSLLQKVKDFFDSASNEDLDRIIEEVNCLDDGSKVDLDEIIIGVVDQLEQREMTK